MPSRLFDARLVRLHRTRAAARFEHEAFLHRKAAADLADRIATVNRPFERGLAIGAPALTIDAAPQDKVSEWVGVDCAAALAGRFGVACDPDRLPFADGSFDVVSSLLVLHAIDDVPKALAEIVRVLRPDGFFVGALFGGETLQELRSALLHAESETTGGAAARVSPFASLQDMAALMQRAGFALPVADVDRVRVRYREPLRLLRDLRGMGETCALADRAPPLRRGTIAALAERFERMREGEDARAPMTFDIVTLTGWRPHPSQPKPLKPGSAAVSLTTVFAQAAEKG